MHVRLETLQADAQLQARLRDILDQTERCSSAAG